MFILFIELAGKEAQATLAELADTLSRDPACQGLRLLESTEAPLWLLVSEWQTLPELETPAGARVWRFKEAATASDDKLA